uniref:Uncharacterized protein n=1 Tax=Sus scrofa TaxID=9823 RepID=A0A8W4FQF6_PIG
ILSLSIYFLFNFGQFYQYVSWCIPLWVYFIWYSLCFLDLSEWFLFHVREVLAIISWNIFFCPLLPLFSFWHPYNTDVGAFNFVPQFSETLFICFQTFFSFLFCIRNFH